MPDEHPVHAISAYLTEICLEEIWDRYGNRAFTTRDGSYTIANDEDYKSLGENPSDEEAPLILKHEDGNTFFEIDIWVNCYRVSPEQKRIERETLERMRNRMKKSNPVSVNPSQIQPSSDGASGTRAQEPEDA